MTNFTGTVRRCIDDYDMIAPGETVAVGISGGKDSLSLLYALHELSAYHPKNFKLHAFTLSMGWPGMDFSPVADFCKKLDIPYTIRESQIAKLIFEERKEPNPCALCAKMRRGALNDMIREAGISKIALGHHFDDAVETFALSLFYEGRISCFQPVTYMSRSGVTQIRPMLYLGEGSCSSFARTHALPVVENVCPMDKHSKREEVKVLLRELSGRYPDVKTKIFGAMQRLPLEGWSPLRSSRMPEPDITEKEI